MSLIAFFTRNPELRKRLEENRPRLYRIAFSWCHEAALADDLVQETMEKALKKAGQLRDMDALNTWLYTILNNCWRDHLRRRKETVDVDDIPFESDDSPEDDNQRHQVVTQVRKAIATLPISQRQVLTLVDLEGCTYIEVANILEVPVGTVMSRLCRARRALKERLMNSDLAAPCKETSAKTNLRRVK